MSTYLKKVFLLLIIYFGIVCTLHAQKKIISLREELNLVTKIYGTEFVFDPQAIEGKNSDYQLTNNKASLEYVLKKILYPNDLVFLYIKNNYYSIVTKSSLNSAQAGNANDVSSQANDPAMSANVDAKSSLITGRVTNPDGNALPGVTVTERGTNNSTVTKEDGSFKISTRTKRPVLMFSSVGYAPMQLPVGDESFISVSMVLSDHSLDEVVVIGYGSVKKSDLTGSVGTVNADDLNRNKTTDVLNALQGKVAGVDISSQSGELGAGLNITVRGGSSIYGSSTPLFVIDGVPIDVNPNEAASSSVPSSTTANPLTNINPADIESVEILKDASATAIYGSRGANGVVLITTKSGKAGHPKIDYDGYVSIGNLSKRIDVLSADEFIEYQKLINPTGPLVATGPDSLGSYTPINFDTVPKNDWQKEVYQRAISHSHNLTISGGTAATTFSGNIGVLQEQGIINQNTNDRYSLRLRIDHKASKRLKVGFNIYNSYSELNGATNSGSNFFGNGVVQNIVYAKPIQVYDPFLDPEGFYTTPYELINNAYKKTSLQNLITNVNGSYKLGSNFTLSMILGGTMSNSKGEEFYGSNTFQGYKANGDAYINNIKTRSIINTNQITYDRRFNKDHVLNVIGAFEISSYDFQSNSINGQQFADQSTGVQNISKAGVIAGYNSNHYRNNRLSYITRAYYNLKNRYLFTGSFRADGSDKFGTNNKWAYFPSGAFAWKVTEEPFMAKQKLFSTLKARLSFGATGNERIPAYRYVGTQTDAYYSSMGSPVYGSAPGNKANADLKWEETIQYNAGLDVGFFKHRLKLTADVYFKKTTNMLLPAIIPVVTGFYTQWQNFGRIDNKGLELTISSQNITTKNFSWESNFNISFNKNEIKSLGATSIIPVAVPGEITDLGAVIVGQAIGTGYGYQFDGIYQLSDFTWQNNSDPALDPASRIYTIKPGKLSLAGTAVTPGSFKFKDLNGDGTVNDQDLSVISHSAPKFTGGFTNTFRYKDFDFTVFLQGSYGNEVINQSKLLLEGFHGETNISRDFYFNRWTVDNPSNTYGTFSNSNATARLNSSYYVEDASFLRIKSATLSYTLPNSAIEKLHIQRIRLYASGNNLITFTRYSGYDPEVAWRDPLLTGVDKLAFPRVRTFIFGANVSF